MAATKSPVLWMPDIQGSGCNQAVTPEHPPEAFTAMKFLAFVLTVYNLVSIVTSTSNNNLNNNNLNSNNFNGNINISGKLLQNKYSSFFKASYLEALNSVTGDTNSNAEVNSLNQVSKRRRKRSGNLPKKVISGSFGFVSLWLKLWISREENFICQRARICKLNKLLVTSSNEQRWTSLFAEILRLVENFQIVILCNNSLQFSIAVSLWF